MKCVCRECGWCGEKDIDWRFCPACEVRHVLPSRACVADGCARPSYWVEEDGRHFCQEHSPTLSRRRMDRTTLPGLVISVEGSGMRVETDDGEKFYQEIEP